VLNHTPPPPESQSKDNTPCTQMQIIVKYLADKTVTATMLSEATRIPQKSICRRKRDLEKAGRLWEVEKKPCKITGFKAAYLTTNPKLAPQNSIQLDLFS